MKKKKNSICLILEGTYPYVTGGVSTWVHKLVTGLADFDFQLVHIFTGKVPSEPKFETPSNLKNLVHLPLTVDEAHSDLKIALNQIPEAALYHSLSTGFAGLVGMEIKRQRQTPFLLTEHGIYWHEIEMGVDEIECGFKIIQLETGKMMLGLSWESWLDTFKSIARETYQAADAIATVCRHNQQMQISLGADKNKCQVIPNGVEIEEFTYTGQVQLKTTFDFGLIGRITPIKDILTFIRACAWVKKDFPQARFWIIGPADHDQKYFEECVRLKNSLQLDELIFTGEKKTPECLKWLDVAVLTSQSEAQPFALLEAMAAGKPIIATDVGGCRDLVYGDQDEFGPAGFLCKVQDSSGIASAMLKIGLDAELKTRCSRAGRQRVLAHYSEEKLLKSYRALYSGLMDQ